MPELEDRLVILPEIKREGERFFLSSFKLPDKLTFAGQAIPLDNWQVRERIEYEFYQFLEDQGESIILAKRTGRCFAPAEKQLAEAGLPDDLKYMLLVESKCIAAAYSRAKALENAGGKFVSREDDHERRIDETTRELGHVQAQIQTLDKNLENQHAFLKQVEQHLSALRVSASQRAEQAPAVAEVAPLAQSQAMPSPEAVSPPTSSPVPSSGSMSRSENRSAALMADRESYERTLTRFKDGDLDGARQGFAGSR